MTRRRRAAAATSLVVAVVAVGSLAFLGGCTRRPPPQTEARARYVVGPGYQAGGVWYYPREQFEYDAGGLAVVAADRSGLTADGERFDQGVAAAAHQTLQLPSIARVTNLENGRELVLRLNDRGPASPGRLLEVTRRAAELLGMQPTAATRVRVRLEATASQAAAGGAGGGPQLRVDTAPRSAVQAEALAPPPGVGQSARIRVASAGGAPGSATALSAPQPTDEAAGTAGRLPETVTTVAANPGQLWIRAGEFGRRNYAEALRAKLSGIPGAQVERERRGREERYLVQAGPFADVAQADRALDQALRAGVTDARIVIILE